MNRFLQDNYKNMYEKLSELKWGPFAPKSFGIFPMIAINFNTISDYHWDEHDEPNSLCCLVALGDFDGGQLCFPQLQIVIPLRPGQIVAFSSRCDTWFSTLYIKSESLPLFTYSCRQEDNSLNKRIV